MATPPSAGGGSSLDLGRGFRFVFDDPEWVKKILIGGLFSLLGALLIGIFFVAGYAIRLIRAVAAGEREPLPEWDDLGGIFGDGAKAVGVYLAHLVAIAILPGMMFVVIMLATGGIAALGSSSRGSSALGAVIGLLGLTAWALMILLGFCLAVYLPSAFARLALTGRFGAAFEVGENLAFIRRNVLNYLLALLLYFVGSFLAQFGILLCCVGIFPATFWAMCLAAWGLGEAARLDPQGAPGFGAR
jgi:hypothetical protein